MKQQTKTADALGMLSAALTGDELAGRALADALAEAGHEEAAARWQVLCGLPELIRREHTRAAFMAYQLETAMSEDGDTDADVELEAEVRLQDGRIMALTALLEALGERVAPLKRKALLRTAQKTLLDPKAPTANDLDELDEAAPDRWFSAVWRREALFANVCTELGEAGHCDTFSGMESRRVFREWVEAGRPMEMARFITERANVGPNG